jgi:hypothetical protein
MRTGTAITGTGRFADFFACAAAAACALAC